MFDNSSLFSDAAATSATGNSTAVSINKSPAEGMWIEVVVTAVSGTSPTLDVTVHQSDDSFASENQQIATIPQITAVGRHFVHVQSKKAALRLTYTLGGTTPSFTITAGIVSGAQRDAAA